MDTTNLRLATKEDLPELATIYADAYNTLHIGEEWTHASALKLLTFIYNEQPDLFFVAEVDAKIVGAIGAKIKPWWDGNHLIEGEIFIDPHYQKRKIGVQLIKKLFTVAKAHYQVISWDTFTHKIYEHPLSWYKNLGFEEITHWTMISGNIEKVLRTIKE